MNVQEYGKCEICGKDAPLERTYFNYPIDNCECCSSKDENGKNNHFVLVRHCEKCIPPLPSEIYPIIKNKIDGKKYKVTIKNMLPDEICGTFTCDRNQDNAGGLKNG